MPTIGSTASPVFNCVRVLQGDSIIYEVLDPYLNALTKHAAPLVNKISSTWSAYKELSLHSTGQLLPDRHIRTASSQLSLFVFGFGLNQCN